MIHIFLIYLGVKSCVFISGGFFLSSKLTPSKQENCKSPISTIANNCCGPKENKPLIKELRHRPNFISND